MEKSEFSDELKEELSHLLSTLKDVGSHLMNTLSSAGHIAKMSLNKASEEWEKGKTIAALQMLGEVIKEILTNGDTSVKHFLW